MVNEDKLTKAQDLGRDVKSMEDKYQAMREELANDPDNSRLRKRVLDMGDELYFKRAEGRQAEVDADIRTAGLGVKVEDNK